jgi:hypothetical protein
VVQGDREGLGEEVEIEVEELEELEEAQMEELGEIKIVETGEEEKFRPPEEEAIAKEETPEVPANPVQTGIIPELEEAEEVGSPEEQVVMKGLQDHLDQLEVEIMEVQEILEIKMLELQEIPELVLAQEILEWQEIQETNLHLQLEILEWQEIQDL